MSYNSLTDQEKQVLLHKKTDSPYTGEYEHFFAPGTFICKQCNAPLFSSKAKFEANCGWPAFDQSIDGNVLHIPDAYSNGTEIVCAHCKGHLGHVFKGEQFTETNTRHCVNSTSIRFIPDGKILPAILNSDH